MTKFKTIAAFLTLASFPLQAEAQLKINELMQSNIDCIMDDLNDFPDSWVELYYDGTTSVNLKDYKLGTTANADEAWQLPSKTIGAGGHALVYCDKVGKNMHTDFRLESGKGCTVYLFKGTEIVDSLPEALKKQPAPNIAYGRKTDGSDEWGYQLTPTPEAANSGQTCERSKMLGEPVFSQEGRVLTSSQSLKLELSVPEGSPEGTEIRYTLDGSEPTRTSSLYQASAPFTFSSNKVIRAKLFCDGWLSPRSTVHSYIFHGRAMTIPVISITTNSKYLNDSKIGIYSSNRASDGKENYNHNWRRPMNIEFFMESAEASDLNQLCEARIAGGATRSAKLKTFAIYAHKRFGEKRFDYEFFPDQKPGMTDFKSLMLRNAGNDFDGLYMRDAIIQRSVSSHADIDWQAWRPAVVYINGQYKGMLNIRERSNEDNIYTNYDGLEDLDMFENWNELKEGTWDNYNAFKAFYNEHGHTLAEYDEWMDWKEFICLIATGLYHVNLDFPGNNIVMWRPTAEGGKWRWVMKDTDFGLGLYGRDVNYKVLNWLYNPNYDSSNNWGANSYDATRLFRRLMEDEDFFREFIDRTAIYMGDFLNERGTREVWDPMLELVKGEIYKNKEQNKPSWAGWWYNSTNEYNNELNNARTWLSRRTDIFYTQLASYYKLGTPRTLVINKDAQEEVKTVVNGVEVTSGYLEGKFFQNRQLTVQGIAAEGREVQGWHVKTVSTTNQVTESNVNEPVYTFMMPECKSLTLTALFGESSGIENVLADDADWQSPDAIYDLQGHRVEHPTKGIYIMKKGNKSKKFVIR